MLATTDIQTRLRDVKTKTAAALQTAEADTGASEATNDAVQAAHLAICILKTEV